MTITEDEARTIDEAARILRRVADVKGQATLDVWIDGSGMLSYGRHGTIDFDLNDPYDDGPGKKLFLEVSR